MTLLTDIDLGGFPAPPSNGALDLATVLSTAARIEPELMRAMRLGVLPHLDVSVEADLWFSEWVESRSSTEVVLDHSVVRWLRRRLSAWVADAGPGSAVSHAWEVIARVHASESPALLLEEYVTWLAVSGDVAAAEEALRPALRALVSEGRIGVAQWFAAAWERFPEEARTTITAWQLAQATSRRVGTPLRIDEFPGSIGLTDLAAVVDDLPDVRIGVRRHDASLEIGARVRGEGAAAILVPDSDPVVLQIAEGESWLTITPSRSEIFTMTVGPGSLRLRTARGTIYDIVPPKEEAPFSVATGKIEIDLTTGLPMAGYDTPEPRQARGTNRPLTVRCTVLWNESKPYVITTADVFGFRRGVHTRIRTAVTSMGVSSSAFVLTATHTHNAPGLDEDSELEKHDSTVRFTARLVDQIVGLVRHVLDAPRAPCTLDYAVLGADFSLNREGLPLVERDVPVLVARDSAGAPRAILFSYGTHPVAGGVQDLFDPDYPGSAIHEIEMAYPDAHAQFLLGPAGDQNPIAIGDFTAATALGADLGQAVVAALGQPGRYLNGPISAVYTNVDLPLDITLAPENLAIIRSNYAARSGNPAVPRFARRHAERMVGFFDVSPLSAIETSVLVPVQRWRFGGAPGLIMIFSGGEVVSGYAAELRRESGGSERLWFLAYANDVSAYIPTDDLLRRPSYAGGVDEDFPGIAGGSMVVYGHHGHFKAASGRDLDDGVEQIFLKHLRLLAAMDESQQAFAPPTRSTP